MTLGRTGNTVNLAVLEKQFDDDEDELLVAKVEQSGRYWTRVAQLMERHSAHMIKNRSIMLTCVKPSEEFRQRVQREQQEGTSLEAVTPTKGLEGEGHENQHSMAIGRRYFIWADLSVHEK
jgi:hypothetical protein